MNWFNRTTIDKVLETVYDMVSSTYVKNPKRERLTRVRSVMCV